MMSSRTAELFVDVSELASSSVGPLCYPASAMDLVKRRETSFNQSLVDKLKRNCAALELNPRYIEQLNVCDYLAMVYGIGGSATRLDVFTASLAIILYEFDDHFDSPAYTPENVSRLSGEMRSVLRSLSALGLGGLRGDMSEWPSGVPCKKAYLWLLRETENLREGSAELLHYAFLDYCFGVEQEIVEWSPDMYSGRTSAWNMERCSAVRKRAAGVVFAVVPMFTANNWITRKHLTSTIDQLYNASVIVSLANDIMGYERDTRESASVGMKMAKIASLDEIIRHHNERVRSLRQEIQALQAEDLTRRFLEEIELVIVGFFLWQRNAKRYRDARYAS